MKTLLATAIVLMGAAAAQAQSGWGMDLGGGSRYYFGGDVNGYSQNLGGGITRYQFTTPYRSQQSYDYDYGSSYYYQPYYRPTTPRYYYQYDANGNYHWWYRY